MRRVTVISRRAVTYPGVVFWLAFVGVLAGLFSSLVFYYLYLSRRPRRIPSLAALLAERQCGPLLRCGFFLSAVPMCLCGILSHRFFGRLNSPFLILLSASQILSVVSMAIMLYFEGAVHVFAEFLYFTLALCFHSLVTFFSHKSKQTAALSFPSPFLIALFCLVWLVARACSAFARGAGQVASLFEIITLVLIHFKYIGDGTVILGARFIARQRGDDEVRAETAPYVV
jgi:hypothetical protein